MPCILWTLLLWYFLMSKLELYFTTCPITIPQWDYSVTRHASNAAIECSLYHRLILATFFTKRSIQCIKLTSQYCFNQIQPYIFQNSHVTSVKHTGLVSFIHWSEIFVHFRRYLLVSVLAWWGWKSSSIYSKRSSFIIPRRFNDVRRACLCIQRTNSSPTLLNPPPPPSRDSSSFQCSSLRQKQSRPQRDSSNHQAN